MPAKEPEKDIVLKLVDVEKDYPMGNQVYKALRGVNLEVKKGEFVSIMGPSGSGKSTLLHLIGCLDVPTRGEVYIDSLPVSKMNPDERAELRARKIGFVFQAFNLVTTITAFENVALPMQIINQDDEKINEKSNFLLKTVGLTNQMDHRPSELSGGEKQRVAIARALVNDPVFILADEPTGNLDSKSAKDVMDFMDSLHRQGSTIIIVTHEPVVAQYAERIIHIRDGLVERIETNGMEKNATSLKVK